MISIVPRPANMVRSFWESSSRRVLCALQVPPLSPSSIRDLSDYLAHYARTHGYERLALSDASGLLLSCSRDDEATQLLAARAALWLTASAPGEDEDEACRAQYALSNDCRGVYTLHRFLEIEGQRFTLSAVRDGVLGSDELEHALRAVRSTLQAPR